MKTRLIALLVALSASAAAPAFAGGYGPAPSYRSAAGVPVVQRGQRVQTLAAERADAAGSQAGYGGVTAGGVEAGGRMVTAPAAGLYAHH